MNDRKEFTAEQQHYLQGLALGADVARKVQSLPVVSNSAAPGVTVSLGAEGTALASDPLPAGPERVHIEAQDRQTTAGGKLCAEEQAKRDKHPLDMWDQMHDRAAAAEFPQGSDVFLTKFHGLFYVAPAQDAYMCRLRIPGGHLTAHQLRGIADLAENFAGGYADVTTRANLQLREIGPADPLRVIEGLRDLGIINVGAGADNIRNVTASPLSGVEPQELIETLPLARQLHHHILNHRELYGLPRKFNIAFDGSGSISALDDTNDIGFHAVEVPAERASEDCPAGVYFQLALGGITGHRDFARYTGVLVRPDECVPLAAAIVRVYLENGNRTDRKKARLKYLLDDWGFEKFLSEVATRVKFPLRWVPVENCRPTTSDHRHGHVGFHPQKQEDMVYVGVVLPVGRITVAQLRGLAEVANRYGSGTIRLTVWQNLLITDVPKQNVEAVKTAIEELGLDWRATSVRAGLIACTGNTGCKYSASNTKGHAMRLAQYVEDRVELDQPVNIHLTGCHHSCAQHYIGDIGLLAASVEQGDDMVEGYHLYVGGGYGTRQRIGRELFPALPFADVPPTVTRMLQVYFDRRADETETFAEFTNRFELEDLKQLFAEEPATVA